MSINTQSVKYIKYEFGLNQKNILVLWHDFMEESGSYEKPYCKAKIMFNKMTSLNKIKRLTHAEKRYIYDTCEGYRMMNDTEIIYYYASQEAKALLDDFQEVKENLQQENAIIHQKVKILENLVINQSNEINTGNKVIEQLKEARKMDKITYEMAQKEHDYDIEEKNDKLSELNHINAELEEKINLQKGETQYVMNEIHEQLQQAYKDTEFSNKNAEDLRLEIYKLQNQNAQLQKACGVCPEFLAKNY